MEEVTTTQRLADQIKRLRRNLGWSARRLADECARIGAPSLTRSTIAKIESGTRKSVTATEVKALAQALRTTATDLLEGDAASVSTAHAEAAARLIEAVGNVETAVIQVGALLVIKNEGLLTVRDLSPAQMEQIRRNPGLVTDPARLIEQLEGGSLREDADHVATAPEGQSIEASAM
ncbi:helix-turn-helix transcriptional regulator [Nonomuraea wenchangensis]|uniref:helix-turn-helix domain-containing protein n=1 Tax=Nonomuraea wenchangensis TaxID=568860 RepID=UPI00342DA04C